MIARFQQEIEEENNMAMGIRKIVLHHNVTNVHEQLYVALRYVYNLNESLKALLRVVCSF